MARFVERSLLKAEVSSSNPVIGKNYNEHLFIVNCIEKTKIKKKRPAKYLKRPGTKFETITKWLLKQC